MKRFISIIDAERYKRELEEQGIECLIYEKNDETEDGYPFVIYMVG